MKTNFMSLIQYDADEGKVFDWANLEEHMIEDEEGNKTQEHLYAKTLFIGPYDDIKNYVEIDAPIVKEESNEAD